jgi:glycosyltransferase involved in cell wall biosynthesis
VGEGPELDALQARARELTIAARLTFVPRRHGPELQDIYRRHSVLAVPSTWDEPFGMVALEGLASGCRVVVTNRGGLPEAVGNVGKVVAPTRDALTRGLAEALEQAEAPLSIEEAGAIRAHLSRHRPGTFVTALLELTAARWPQLAPKVASLVVGQ